jgi:hypothetical protein
MCLDKLNKIDEYLSTSVDDLIISPLTINVINKEFVQKFNELTKKFGASKIYFFLKTMRGDDKMYKKFLYNDVCPKCDKTFEKGITISDLKSGVNFTCLTCIEKQKNSNKIESVNYDKQTKVTRFFNTREYINKYLNPLNSFKKGLPLSEKWGEIRYDSYHYNTNDIVEHIKKMDYKSFLQTPYWKTVSFKRKVQSDFKCQLCGSNKNLETHHPTYDIKGEEISNMSKLTVLCHVCHEKHHKH